MAKTELTEKLERDIFRGTIKNGVWGCFEVTIGPTNRYGRVDYLTYDSKGKWRCYEIKVSVSDFRSQSKKTFVGHYNYYVLTKELYEKVKDEIPNHIGIYIGNWCKKRAKKQELQVDEQILKNSLIRSLFRDCRKGIESEDPFLVDSYKRQIDHLRKTVANYRTKYQEINAKAYEKFGRGWWRDDESEGG